MAQDKNSHEESSHVFIPTLSSLLSALRYVTFVGQYGVMTEQNGFYYMRARYYDPNVGRFISEDPIGFEGGDVNLYAYAGNNPVMMIDPSGKAAFWYHFADGYRVARNEGKDIWDSLAFGASVMRIDFNSSGYKNVPEAHATTASRAVSSQEAINNSLSMASTAWSSDTTDGKALAVHIWRDVASHAGSYFPLNPTTWEYVSHIVQYDLTSGGSFETVVQSRINSSKK